MATFFTKVPRELCDKVYHELLRADDALDPDRRLQRYETIRMYCSPSKDLLYPAILHVCKQAHAEASIVLYGQNRFRFEATRYFDMHPRLSPYWGMLDLDFTRNMHGGEYHNRTIDLFLVKNFLGCIADLGCLLKTLRIRLSFTTHMSAIKYYDDAIGRYEDHMMNELIRDKDLQELLTDLNVENAIEVVVEGSLLRSYHSDLAVFLTGIAHMKSLTITEHHLPQLERPSTSGKKGQPSRRLRLVMPAIPMFQKFVKGNPPIAIWVNLRSGAVDTESVTWILKPAAADAYTVDPEAIGLMEEI